MGTTWEVLSLLTSLEVLYLHGNNLVGKIPAELGNLKNLVSIDLSFNKLTGEIPASFANLTRLKLLNLFANELQGVLPEFVGELSQLEILQAWENNLTGELPANLGKNGRLLTLDVTDNRLTDAISPGPLRREAASVSLSDAEQALRANPRRPRQLQDACKSLPEQQLHVRDQLPENRPMTSKRPGSPRQDRKRVDCVHILGPSPHVIVYNSVPIERRGI